MFEFLQSPQAGFVLSVVLLIWSFVWTLFAMWKSSKKGHKFWFIIILLSLMSWYLYPNIFTIVLGLFAALPIFYFYLFSRIGFKSNKLSFEKWKKSSSKPKKKS